jgi:hypothetical protein
MADRGFFGRRQRWDRHGAGQFCEKKARVHTQARGSYELKTGHWILAKIYLVLEEVQMKLGTGSWEKQSMVWSKNGTTH